MIHEHPSVKESAVIGVPSELSEEEVMAVITLKENETLDMDEFIAFCEKRMAAFAVPRYVRIVDELPKNTSLRVEKYKLKEEGITKDTWDREKERSKIMNK